MYKMNIVIKVVSIIYLFSVASSCKKYLGTKTDSTLQVIETVEDLQSLLDDYRNINQNYPGLSEVLSDDYYILNGDWVVSDVSYRNFHTWVKDDNTSTVWNNAYSVVLTTNIVLNELKNVDYSADQQDAWNQVKGNALFLRAYYFYGLAQLFALPYNNNENILSDPGIPLKLNPDINEKITRASLKETYDQITKDLKQSASLLPLVPFVNTRPGKGAAYGALARTYLVMGEYDSALAYANRYLAIHDSLVDYNSIVTSASPLADKYRKETIFNMRSNSMSFLVGNRPKIDTMLYRSYESFDLRKTIHFRAVSGAFVYRGDFDGLSVVSNYAFSGIYTDEIYLIKAEVLARQNEITTSFEVLNKLLKTRYATGQFTPVVASDRAAALERILAERKKQLIRRGVRWTDIRRLNNEIPNSIEARRIINSQSYYLPQKPYLLLLPKIVIGISGIQQNN